MKYLRQIHSSSPTSTAGAWFHVKADSPIEAATKGLEADKLPETFTIMLADVTKRNRWPNGRPQKVTEYTIKFC